MRKRMKVDSANMMHKNDDNQVHCTKWYYIPVLHYA